MNRSQEKQRSIRFFSEKNETMLTVHSREARKYAERLEARADIKNYEVSAALDLGKFQYINPIDIRREYLSGEWFSDFLLHFEDGSLGVRELVEKNSLTKRAVVERLELSRRYWSLFDIRDWKLVITGREGAYVF